MYHCYSDFNVPTYRELKFVTEFIVNSQYDYNNNIDNGLHVNEIKK